MLDLEPISEDDESNDLVTTDVPKFDDVYVVFKLLHKNLNDARKLLQIRPVYRKQQENFDRVLKCVTHLMYLLDATLKTDDEKQLVHEAVRSLVKDNIRSACTNDTLLHLCVSRLNIIKSGYFSEGTSLRVRKFSIYLSYSSYSNEWFIFFFFQEHIPKLSSCEIIIGL